MEESSKCETPTLVHNDVVDSTATELCRTDQNTIHHGCIDALINLPAVIHQNVAKKMVSPRSYQQELAEPGINGENYIICAPTGSGKTLVAAMIIENHMIKLRERGHYANGNILFIVKTQQLAHQQQKTLTEYLKGLSITEITGETESSIYLALPQVDIVVCTSGKLCSELDNNMIHLRSATLLVFDECHHAIGGDTYALILEYYLLAKQEGTHLQVIGLTASPGAGRGKYPTLEKVLDHQTNLCARLDATSGFKCVQKYENELNFFVNSPNHFSHALPQRSYTDPFIEEIVKVMSELETMLPLPSLPIYYRGSSAYQQWVINEIEAAQLSGMDGQRKQISILELLHEYAMSLITYEDFEIDNALEILNDACNSTDENCLNETEIKLKDIHLRLRCNLALLKKIPNPLLIRSEDILYQHFSSKPNSKGLFFVRAVKHTEYVVNWIQSSRKLSTVIKPGSIFGYSRKAGMSKEEQIHTLDKFRRGDFNLLITTSVLEEGLDVPDCNLVIRFQILSNEIADVQAEGRARAKDSTMHTIVVSESYMHHNQLINNDKKDLALHGVKLLSRSPINQLDIARRQQIFLTKREYRLKAEEAKNIWNTEDVEGRCRRCDAFAYSANSVCKYGTNVSSPSYVISSKCFIEQRMKKKKRSGPEPATVGDYTRPYKIACVNCDDEWGIWGCWKNGVHFPVLKCKSFTFVNKITRDRISPKQWKKVPFRILSYEEYNEQDSN